MSHPSETSLARDVFLRTRLNPFFRISHHNKEAPYKVIWGKLCILLQKILYFMAWGQKAD